MMAFLLWYQHVAKHCIRNSNLGRHHMEGLFCWRLGSFEVFFTRRSKCGIRREGIIAGIRAFGAIHSEASKRVGGFMKP
jgi:hypothetical protein